MRLPDHATLIGPEFPEPASAQGRNACRARRELGVTPEMLVAPAERVGRRTMLPDDQWTEC